MNRFERTAGRLAIAPWGIVVILSMIFRIYLAVVHPHNESMSVIYGMAVGPIFDTAVAIYSFVPFVLFLITFLCMLTKRTLKTPPLSLQQN